MDCSIKIGKSRDCSEHSVGRRSIDKNELVTIQYKIEDAIGIEQFGNIVTSKTQRLEEPSNSALKLYNEFILLLILKLHITQF